MQEENYLSSVGDFDNLIVTSVFEISSSQFSQNFSTPIYSW